MTIAILKSSEITASNRMDAGYHISRQRYRMIEDKLREKMDIEQAREIVTQMVTTGPSFIKDKLAVYGRGNDARNRLEVVIKDHPYEGAAMIIHWRADIVDAVQLQADTAQARADNFLATLTAASKHTHS